MSETEKILSEDNHRYVFFPLNTIKSLIFTKKHLHHFGP